MISIILQFPNLSAKLMAAREDIQREMIVAVQTNRGMLFDNEGAYNGHDAWDSLAFRTGQILARRGVLKKSLAPMSANGNPGPGGYVNMDGQGTIRLGTNVAYAGMMNWGTTKMPGGVLRPTHAKALRIPLPEGKWANADAKALRKTATKSTNPNTGKDERVIFRKWVKIPARRFDTLTVEDERDFAEAASIAIAEALR